ncbi:MAG TPA: DUF4380 domain-containing protein [Prolixibacteraceae bacterium]|nr:DUF4380 domain-containing protein [Prolixibacteraceae bacterium]
MRKGLQIIVIILFSSCTTPQRPLVDSVIRLSNGTIEIGLLPDVGGRLVRVSLVGKENIIQSDSSLWNEPPDKRPSLDPTKPFKSYNGSINWLNPQSEWWVKQDLFPDLKVKRSPWPPDPYLIYSKYKITDQKAGEITMISPESPYTHVQFTKTYRIEGNKVFLTTSARNCSNDTVSWGLWFNTRMNGWDQVFVPADSVALIKSTDPRISPEKPDLIWENGYYSYNSPLNDTTLKVFKGKSFFSPVSTPVIAGFKADQWLIIRSGIIDKSAIHPEQARVELYIENSTKRNEDLQELEMQFAYEKIAPGSSITASQIWEVVPGTGLTTKDELGKELMKYLGM